MDVSEDTMSSEDIRIGNNSPAVKLKPKKRSLVERELETNMTARVTSPIANGDGASMSRYGRARRLKADSEFCDTEKAVPAAMKSSDIFISPGKSPVSKMRASNSPVKVQSPSREITLDTNLRNQIENICNTNISLSRFGSEEKKANIPTTTFSKSYMRKDLIQTKEKELTVTLIKDLFSPGKSSKPENSHLKNILERSSDKYTLTDSVETKPQNGYVNISSVIKTLDFDGNKKKKKESKDGKIVLSKSDLFHMEANCEYQVGDLAWARMGTYPFWPCIITREPFSELFVKKKLFGRIERDVIHVTYFADNGRRSWIVESMLRKFRGKLEFETARDQFTAEAKKKDPRLYTAFFISEKKQSLWNKSVAEAEMLQKEPKRFRVDLLYDLLAKSKVTKVTPKQSKSEKITRTDSDVSLSESLYDTLFSEDDGKNDELDRSKSKRNKSLDVSEVVTACLDNMAAKTGITKIQRQSHMDRWLQKAKSKTPEKSQMKVTVTLEKIDKESKNKDKLSKENKKKKKTISKVTPAQKSYSLRKSVNESQNLLSHHNEHDYSSKYIENMDKCFVKLQNCNLSRQPVDILYKNQTVNGSDERICTIDKVVSLRDGFESKNDIEFITTIIKDEVTEPEEMNEEINISYEGLLDTDNSLYKTDTENLDAISNDTNFSLMEVNSSSFDDNCNAISTNALKISEASNNFALETNSVSNVNVSDDKYEENITEPVETKVSISISNEEHLSNDPVDSNQNSSPQGTNKSILQLMKENEESMEIDEAKEDLNIKETETDSNFDDINVIKSERVINENIVNETIKLTVNKTLFESDTNVEFPQFSEIENEISATKNKILDIGNDIVDRVSKNLDQILQNNINTSVNKNEPRQVDSLEMSNYKVIVNGEVVKENFLKENSVGNKVKNETKALVDEIGNGPYISDHKLNVNIDEQLLNGDETDTENSVVIQENAVQSVYENDLVKENYSNGLVEKSVDVDTNEELNCKITPISVDEVSAKNIYESVIVEHDLLRNDEYLKHIKDQLLLDSDSASEFEDFSASDLKLNFVPNSLNKLTNGSLKQSDEAMVKVSESKITKDGCEIKIVENKSTMVEDQTSKIKNGVELAAGFTDARGEVHLSNSSSELIQVNGVSGSIHSPARKINDELDIKTASIICEGSDVSVTEHGRLKEKVPNDVNNYKESHCPRFLTYLELKKDKLIDKHPQLSNDEIVAYLHKTWLYEESHKPYKTDDVEQASLVKGSNQEPFSSEADDISFSEMKLRSTQDSRNVNNENFAIPAKDDDINGIYPVAKESVNVDTEFIHIKSKVETPSESGTHLLIASPEAIKENGFLESKDSSPKSAISEELDSVTSYITNEDKASVTKCGGWREKQVANNAKKLDKTQDPEFLKYLDLKQDELIDLHPEFTFDEIVAYLYKTWLYEESLKPYKTDDVEQASLVKGSNQEPFSSETDDIPFSEMKLRSIQDSQNMNNENFVTPAKDDDINGIYTVAKESVNVDTEFIIKSKVETPSESGMHLLTASLEAIKENGFLESKDSSPKSAISEELDSVTSSITNEDKASVTKCGGRTEKQIANNEKKLDKTQDPEFLKYLELKQDALIDLHPELTYDEIVAYLYKTWLYEESAKDDSKKTEEIKQLNLVKGLNQDPPPKRVRKRVQSERKKLNDVGKIMLKETKSLNEFESKEKPKRKIAQAFYNEDFSDIEEEIQMFEIFKNKLKEDSKVTNPSGTGTIQTSEIKTENQGQPAQNITQEKYDIVEIYFEQLTQPKPNIFKGIVREKVCEICEKPTNLVKCKGCHGMFHFDCVRKETEVFETPFTVSRRYKKKKKGRKLKALTDSNGIDSESHSDDKSQDPNISEELQDISIDNLNEHAAIVIDAERFEAQLSEKMKEMLETAYNQQYDSYSSDDGLDWRDTVPGKCKIVDVTLKPRSQPVDHSNFKCNNCQKEDTPLCFVCKSPVSPKDQNDMRQKCQVAHCYKYYHLECLNHWPQTQLNSGEPSRNNKKKINEFYETVTCPRHVCHTCVSDDPRGCKTRFCGDKLARCVRCPATYHSFTKCLPAGTQILTASHIICPRHYEHRPGKVPCHVNTGWCFICAEGGSLICCEYCPTSFHAECLNIDPPEGGYMCEDCETGRLPLYGEMVWVKLGHYRWWPGIVLHPGEIPDNIMAVKHSPGEFVVRFFGQYDHYWVNRGRVFPFQDGDDSYKVTSQKSKIDEAFALAMKHAHRAWDILKSAEPNDAESSDIASSLLPPHYVKLKVNKPSGSLCGRRVDVQESSLTQCECDPLEEDPCGPDTHCLNRMLSTECGPSCRAGERCNNRAFEKRLYPKLVPYRTPHRGWGLKTLEDIKAGQFVIEYVGELIDMEEFRRRMDRKHEIRDENFYFLTLDKERMIDAGPKGNLARFMNHCCEPNCETQKWTVFGDVRIGLFAIGDIPANSEVTFNYKLECSGVDKKRCMCGAKRCSGYIGAKPKQDETQPKKIKRPYKKRKNAEESPSTSQSKPKRPVGRPAKPRELTEIEKDLLIIKNATNLSSDSEGSGRLSSLDTERKEDKERNALKRKRVNFSTEEKMRYFSPPVKRAKLDNDKSCSEVGD